MRISGPITFDLELDREVGRAKPVGGFRPPATREKCPKLYLVALENRIVYVGITTQRMSNRLRQGYAANGAHGYHGYKFKDGEKLRLFVWEVTELNGHENPRRELETLEAEVVFLCRQEDDNWPESQNEIHFHPSKKLHRSLAKGIFDAVRRADGAAGVTERT